MNHALAQSQLASLRILGFLRLRGHAAPAHPESWSAGRVSDGDDFNRIGTHFVEHNVREAQEREATIPLIRIPHPASPRVLDDSSERSLNRAEKLSPETASPPLVPAHCFAQVDLRVRKNDEPNAHFLPSSSSRRPRTSAHSEPRTSRASAASLRRRSSEPHAAAHSGSTGPSTLSINSAARRSRSPGSRAKACAASS